MRTERLQESRDSEFQLSEFEAASLASLGKRLASKATWWGGGDADDEFARERSVIRVQQKGPSRWSVRVTDAIGVIAIPGLQLVVDPKIPLEHLLLMFAKAGVWPRLDEHQIEAEQSRNLLELVATWYLSSAEGLLRFGLVRDYQEVRQNELTVRGRIELLSTASAYYAGHLNFLCEYDEYTYDTPLNRILRAAAQSIVATPLMRKDLRERAMRVAARVEDAGELQPGDLLVAIDRRTANYEHALLLGKALLKHLGRSPLEGGNIGWSFLIRTPETVEDALRSFLADAMPHSSIRKDGRQLTGTTLTLNPDLVFGSPIAVGDVKYKLSQGDWDRPDLYQLVAFATGYRVQRALLVRFRGPNTSLPRPGDWRNTFVRANLASRPTHSGWRSSGALCR